MSVQNGERLATKQDLADMYQGILPYLGGMPEIVANKFSKGDLYSTDEKMIGQWTDGKPVYQRTVQVTVPSTSSAGTYASTSIDLEIANLDKFLNSFGILLNFNAGSSHNSDTTVQLPYINGNNGIFWFLGSRENGSAISKIDFRNSNPPWNGNTAFVTVQYTKTTDSAISIGDETDYSTTEKIVGTWIDGSPIYAITIVKNSPTTGLQQDLSGYNIAQIIEYEVSTNRSSSIGSQTITGNFIDPSNSANNFITNIVTTQSWYCNFAYSGTIEKTTLFLKYTKTT